MERTYDSSGRKQEIGYRELKIGRGQHRRQESFYAVLYEDRSYINHLQAGDVGIVGRFMSDI